MKINFKHKLPAISDAEIRSKKDFDGLLHRRNQFVIKRNKRIRLIRNFSWSLLALAILSTSIFIINRHKQEKKKVFLAPTSVLEQDSFQLKKSVPIKTKSKPSSKQNEHKSKTDQNENDDNLSNNQRKEQTQKESNAEAINTVEERFQQAYPIVGFDSLYTYLNNSIRYPENLSSTDTISGTVNVLFTIDTAGNAKNIIVENSLGKPFDDEAKRLLSSMPPWEPAKMNDKPIETKMSLPLTFSNSKKGK